MLRLFHAELYKLKKGKSLYACAIVTAAFVLLVYGMLFLADNIQKGNLENGTGGIIISADGSDPEEISGSILESFSVTDMMQEVFSSDFLGCILAIFVCIFVVSEFSSGMLKNIVGKGCPRGIIYLAKLSAAVLASFFIALTGVAAALIFGRLFLGADTFSAAFWKQLPAYIVLQLFMTAAAASLFAMISECSRTIAGGIAIGICCSAFSALLLNIIDMQFADSNFIPSMLWPLTRMSSFPTGGVTMGYATESILVALFWILLTTGFGVWHFMKTDIK